MSDNYWTSTTPPTTVERALPRGEPRDWPANDNDVPDPPVSVGPNSSEGYGNTHAAYPAGGPPPVQAWSGWPVGWDTPAWNTSAVMGAHERLSDVAWAAIDLNASVLSTMPPYVSKGETAREAPAWLENPEPLVYESWEQFAKELFWCFQSVGEVFVVATARYAASDREEGRPRRFMVANPAFVNVEHDNGKRAYTIAGEPVDAADILHIKYASWPSDLHGHGPLEIAGARLLAANALTHYGAELASNGGMPPAVIKTPKRLQRAQLEQIQADWVAARRSHMGVPAVLAEGAELDAATGYLRDMALSDLQRFSEARISVLLGVPPFLLGLPQGEGMTYSNVTSLFDYHWRASLRPKAQAVMSALSNWALPRGSDVELNRDEYIRPGLFERSQSYQMLIGAGVLTPDEVRVMESFAPRDSADGAGLESAANLAGKAGTIHPERN